MDRRLESALMNIDASYNQLVEIANEILRPIIGPANELVDKITSVGNNMPTDDLRFYMLQLQLRAYEISETKEKSVLKATLAEALQKEAFAIKVNSMDGSMSAREKLALVEVSGEVASEALYSLIAGLLNAKVDQLQRLVDVLKSILMSRMQETKFMNVGTSSEVGPTLAPTGRTILNE